MDRIEYGKNVVIEGLLFEYSFLGGKHFWVHSRDGKEVYGFFDRGDGTHILSELPGGKSWHCTTPSGIAKQVAYWEVLAGRAEAPFRSSEIPVPS